MIHVGTTIRPGENINFSLDDKGEMYINAAGGGIPSNLPWCSGIFKDMSIPANNPVLATPIFQDGDASMISGNKFIPKSKGLYMLQIGGGGIDSVTALTMTFISKNTMTYINTNNISCGVSTNSSGLQSLSTFAFLEPEEYLTHFLYSHSTLSTISYDGAVHKFLFVQMTAG